MRSKNFERSTSRVMDKSERDKSIGLTRKNRSSIKEAVSRIDPKNEGVIFLGIKKLFKEIEADEECRYCVRMSYVEIYNENIFDLLSTQKKMQGSLHIVENTKTNDFWVKGVNEIIIADAEEAVDLIMSGEENRHFAATSLNHHSSRSHCLIRLFVQKIDKEESILEGICNFVDLAGSEKLSGTTDTSQGENKNATDRLQESKHINKSLFFLTQIIYMKSRMNGAFIPYRNSALTKILKNSIGGNARTIIILCVNPLFRTLAETISTLRFGQRAKKIVNSVTKNKASTGDVDALKNMVADYEKKIQEMENAMKAKMNKGKDNQGDKNSFGPRRSNLMKLIESLQNQKGFLEQKLQRRSGLLQMFSKSKFAPIKEITEGDLSEVKRRTIVSKVAGLLDFFTREKIEDPKAQGIQSQASRFKITDRDFVKKALQEDFVRTVKNKNIETMRELREVKNRNLNLTKRGKQRDEEISRLKDLVDMLLNKKPELTLRLDGLSRDLLIANSSLSIENLSMVRTVETIQQLNRGSYLVDNESKKALQVNVSDNCMKVGFKYSGTYLSKQNLEVQIFGEEKDRLHLSNLNDSRRDSMMSRRGTQKTNNSWVSQVQEKTQFLPQSEERKSEPTHFQEDSQVKAKLLSTLVVKKESDPQDNISQVISRRRISEKIESDIVNETSFKGNRGNLN